MYICDTYKYLPDVDGKQPFLRHTFACLLLPFAGTAVSPQDPYQPNACNIQRDLENITINVKSVTKDTRKYLPSSLATSHME